VQVIEMSAALPRVKEGVSVPGFFWMKIRNFSFR
jgi:hypothetical protein